MTARVGAIVVSHDSAADLPACLVALAAARAKVVVVDNHSSDASAAVARSFAGVTVVAPGRNLGFAGGCNAGLAALPAELGTVAFVNPDVTVDEPCLELAATALDRDPTLGGVAPLLLRPDRHTVDSAGQVLRRWTLEVGDRGYGQPLTAALEQPAPVLAACGALAVFARSALTAAATPAGPWEEGFFCFWEDLELGWRLTRLGRPIRFLPEARAVHRRGAGATVGRGPLRWRRPVELEACILSNRWMTLLRHLHPLDLMCYSPLLLAWDLALVAAGVVRRPYLLPRLLARLPLVVAVAREGGGPRRLRLAELPR